MKICEWRNNNFSLRNGGKVTECSGSLSHSIQLFHVASAHLFFISLVLPHGKDNTKKIKMCGEIFI
jgi:hypothetical protein